MLGNVQRNAEVVRERLSFDTFRILRDLTEVSQSSELAPGHETDDALRLLNRLIQYLAAFNGMVAENMTHGYGWRFLDMGRRLERTRAMIQMIQQLAVRGDALTGGELELLLELADSTMTYRGRYQAAPQLPAVLDLLLCDETNPRSAVYQIVDARRAHRAPADRQRGRGHSHGRSTSRDAPEATSSSSRIPSSSAAASCASTRASSSIGCCGASSATCTSSPITSPSGSSAIRRRRASAAPAAAEADACSTTFVTRPRSTTRRSCRSRITCCTLRRGAHPQQTCVESETVVDPRPAVDSVGEDYFGNPIQHLTVQKPHKQLVVDAHARVEVRPAAQPVALEQSAAWETVREQLAAYEVLDAYELRVRVAVRRRQR